MNKKKWYYYAESNRPGGKIVACYVESGLIDKVALLFCYQSGYCRLYPVSDKGHDTLEKACTIPAHNYIATKKVKR